ncbi:MAG TPA: site-2 protease family protein [Actinomycetota bacterium]|nr:site-2 protease family protein [Actinomycetota bacterium]
MSSRPQRAPRPFAGRTLARPFGIELQIHPSWIISLIILSVAGYNGSLGALPERGAIKVALAIAFGLAIAACIVLHELSHSLVARVYKLPVHRITLFAFGGVSQIEREAPTPSAEFAIAVAGPLSSVVIATLLSGVAILLHPSLSHPVGIWWEIGKVNMVLAIFNLIPAFPMDGGRLLRSGLWVVGGRARGTRWAVRVGRAFAVLAMGGGGALLLIPPLTHNDSGGSLGALWIILIGLFIFNAAGAAGRIEGGESPNQQRDGDSSLMVPGVQPRHEDEQ